MTLTLNPDQEAWLRARVADGVFATVEDAARQLIDDRIAEIELEGDDLAWAKPFVTEALEEATRGEVVPLEEHRRQMAALLAALKP